MKEEVRKLLETTIHLFLRYGIRSVTMDDVAREMGISKKTIYQHFSDRSALVDAAVGFHLGYMQEKCLEIFGQQENPIDQLLEVARFFHSITRQMNPSLLLDLKKLFPTSWKRVNDHRTDFIEKQVLDNLQRGIVMGLYRDDLNIEIVARLYIHLIELIIDDELFPKVKYTYRELQKELVNYHIHGISTNKGIEYLKAKNTEND